MLLNHMGSELTKRVDESKAAKRIGNTRLVKEIKRSEFGQKLKSMVDQRRVDERPTTSRDADDPDGVVMVINDSILLMNVSLNLCGFEGI